MSKNRLQLPRLQTGVREMEMETEKGRRILILDDDPMVGEIACDMLGFLGYEGVHVVAGEEAVALYRQHYQEGTPFTAVITDLTIPGGMGGKEAIQEILAIDPEAVVFVSSGHTLDPVMRNFGDFGFVGALAKPFDLAALRELLQEL
jgi:CheY-like chemotaxis protein